MGTRGSRLVSCQRLVGFLLFSPPVAMVHGSCGEIATGVVVTSFLSFPFLGGLDGLLVESGVRWIEKCVCKGPEW